MSPRRVRVRFAPSPTGHLHVGGARTAIYNWVFAVKHGGDFIIRCEDTDQERSTREAEESVLQDLRWLGLKWKEGPDIGGPLGPYRQSERKEIYKKYADQLIAQGRAYPCFCTDSELEKKKEHALASGQAPQYDGTCRRLSPEARDSKFRSQEAHAVRFHVEQEDQALEDLIRGPVVFKAGMVGDFVLIRSNGLPTYNFACVVDDGLMNISHVIRAEEHLSNTNRQLMLYQALSLPIPHFAHLSLVMGKDAEGNVSKLSKRHGATSVDQYRLDGFSAAAMINYLVQLGWSHPEGKEIFPLEDLQQQFSLERIGKSPSIFDLDKFSWMNGEYLRALSDDVLLARSLPFVSETYTWFLKKDGAYQLSAIQLFKTSLNRFSDLNRGLDELTQGRTLSLEPDAQTFLSSTPKSREVLLTLKNVLEATAPSAWAEAEMKPLIERVKTQSQAKGKELFMSVRIGISGKMHGSDLNKLLFLLGREECLRRIQFYLKE